MPISQTKKYGIIAGNKIEGEDNLYLVNNMIEKPMPKSAPSNLGIIGRYILTADIFDILRDLEKNVAGEIQITDALLKQANEGRVIAYKYNGNRFDCGGVEGYVRATNYFAKKENIG